MVAHYGRAFGMAVLAYDPYVQNLPDGVLPCSSLEELLRKSHIVSLHVPLNNETSGMFGQAQFAWMQPGAYLLNTSRGAVLDEGALLKALESGNLAGAALDVLENELDLKSGCSNTLIEYARRHDNLIITPHIGGATQESIEKADLFLAAKVGGFLQHLPS
jgi:D-3-phosphoglycerate dehydrogenase